MFVDRAQIEAQGGKGGNGCMSFRRERFVPRGGPDGGDGGDGGDIEVVARPGVNSLVLLNHRKKWRAENGGPGGGANRHGRRGENQTIEVPPGTILIDAINGFVIKDLTGPGEQVIAAHGGRGGKGNARFKTATNQAPRLWTPGEPGEVRQLIFELKVIADLGLIGKPNAGKSTLLSRLSSARPQIANYPFTTRYPNLGRVHIDRERSFVMADIPGLVEGAHRGVGLGHEFLKHIERAGMLVHLVEPFPMDQSNPVDNYRAIRNELGQYKKQLADMPEIVVVTKSELPGAERIAALLQPLVDSEVLLISAVTGAGLPRLVARIAQMLEKFAPCSL